MRHAMDPIPSLQAVRADVPAAVAAIAERALAKSPADRFESAQEFSRALATALATGDTGVPRAGKGDVRIAEIPWIGMFYISLQSLGGFNTGWDFGESNLRFRYLNTAHAFMGIIILTFFVGAYTRMILA